MQDQVGNELSGFGGREAFMARNHHPLFLSFRGIAPDYHCRASNHARAGLTDYQTNTSAPHGGAIQYDICV